MKHAKFYLTSALLTLATVAGASEVHQDKRTPFGMYLNSVDAYHSLENDPAILFIDVRTHAEAAFIGQPNGVDATIPIALSPTFELWDRNRKTVNLSINRNFVSEMDNLLEGNGLMKRDRLILISRNGIRSATAARILFKAGYSNVYSVIDGFEGGMLQYGPNTGQRLVNGWKNNALPWSYNVNLADTISE
ncbi:rhodanese-like domain-containing protein [Sedimenticola hydrogenitrophicus]|uniref:rhodanese-like domain-containing protein n=1 Tax=Sedimenticola hydrogenitrophicus TaxID=2967975 RepID=UPI0023AFB7D7|nr:rhodanese-like domain-containing protein [Sedimenticola hydrogenitrophicus]